MNNHHVELVDQIIWTQRELEIAGVESEPDDVQRENQIFDLLNLSAEVIPYREQLIGQAETINEDRLIGEALAIERISGIKSQLDEIAKDFSLLAGRCVENRRPFTRAELELGRR